MKKLIWSFIVIVCLFVISFFLEGINKENNSSSIIPSKLETAIDIEGDTLVYFHQTDCGYCKQATPIIDSIVDEMEVELKTLNLQEYNAGWKQFNITGTPTLVHYRNGIEVSRLDGLRKKEEYKEWFNNQLGV